CALPISAKDRCFDAFGRTDGLKFFPTIWRHRQDHALLSLGDPDLRIRESLVLERGAFEPHLGTDLFPHFADGARQPARATVGDGVIEIAITGDHEGIEHHLFGDRVSNLHRTARNRFTLTRQLGRTERRAVNAVTPRAATNNDDMVAWL